MSRTHQPISPPPTPVRRARRAALAAFALMIAAIAPAHADPSNVSPSAKFCWGENVGFFNLRDAGTPTAMQGVVISQSRLAGYAWGENVGWLFFGDGLPDRPGADFYENLAAPDTGVNIQPGTGDLFGLAWGENVGWVNFDTRSSLGPFGQQARYDAIARRLRGFAWGENIGWINFDDNLVFVSVACKADFNGSGSVDVDDLFAFINAWFARDPRTDLDGSGTTTVDDLFAYLNEWFAGC